ncbi:hypothetical protein [Leptospira sp. GIMC2001]|uniref:hypothetical protein n=1 Tax=Leptospira sp. GIMC2001 TaxID=1513297 RepID=UPI00234B7981|nr:hypothetical protein [Leptospira sp. GIMC2001]WCL47576.1 hypothetical protein O4O04_01005 [Leptospira sp. GIMC2001]
MTISTDNKPTPRDYLEIQEKLEEIESNLPFEVLFYGSRERGDYDSESDFNFYLLASTQDQMKPGFIQKITNILNHLDKIAPVNLVAGDMDTFRLRLNLFEPSVVHLLELGGVFFGDRVLHGFQKEWNMIKANPIPKEKLVPFLNRRIRFYKNLTPRTEKEDAVRMERVASLSVQTWAIRSIPDISIHELVTLDIPARADKMIRAMYSKELDEEILDLLERKNEAISLKRVFQKEKDFQQSQKDTLKSRIRQLKKGIVQETEFGGT